MPERDGYIAGVPCWIDTSQPDPEAAVAFYSGLFDWEVEDVMPPGSEGKYFIARIRGGDVAGIGGVAEGAPAIATWNTYVWVESADETAAKVTDAGGTVLMEPFDVMDSGRMAVLSDPEGAAFCVWEAKQHKGARIVNEAGSLNFNNLNTRDAESAKTFYGSVFYHLPVDMIDGKPIRNLDFRPLGIAKIINATQHTADAHGKLFRLGRAADVVVGDLKGLQCCVKIIFASSGSNGNDR